MAGTKQTIAWIITFKMSSKTHYSVGLTLVCQLGKETPYVTLKNKATLA